MIATSSIISFDIYGTYVNKTPSNQDLLRWSHIGVVVTSLSISTLATAFHRGGVDMTWLLYALGNFTNPGTIPTCLALLWRGQTRAAAVAAPVAGVACGVGVWVATAYRYYGEVSVASTGSTLPCLFGCLTSLFVPLPVTLVLSLARPVRFDWAVFGNIKRVRDEPEGEIGDAAQQQQQQQRQWATPERMQYIKKMSRWAAFWSGFTIVGHVFLWPLAMYGAKMVFSKEVSAYLLEIESSSTRRRHFSRLNLTLY